MITPHNPNLCRRLADSAAAFARSGAALAALFEARRLRADSYPAETVAPGPEWVGRLPLHEQVAAYEDLANVADMTSPDPIAALYGNGTVYRDYADQLRYQ